MYIKDKLLHIVTQHFKIVIHKEINMPSTKLMKGKVLRKHSLHGFAD